MFRIITFLSFLLTINILNSQNLVYNAGMESIEKQVPCHWKVLTMLGQSATYQWFAPPEMLGKSVAKPYTPTHKQGVVQAMLMFRAENSAYMVVELKRPLAKGEEVVVELETVASYMQSGEGLDEIGALLLPFSPTKAADLDNYKTNDILHLASKTFPKLESKDRWMSVESNFVARGGEQYLVIGNFKGNNFAVISRNQSVGNWYQSSAASGNAKGWFGFIFDNVSVTSLKNREADGAYNMMADCGYEIIEKPKSVSPITVVTPSTSSVLPTKPAAAKPVNPYENNPNYAFVPANHSASVAKNITKTETNISATNAAKTTTNTHLSSPNNTGKTPNLSASASTTKTIANPPTPDTKPQTTSSPSSYAATNNKTATVQTHTNDTKTGYYTPSVVAPKVDMQAEVIFFDTNKANLSEKAFVLLDNMAAKLAKNPKLILQINGYAKEEKEKTFAQVRANAVQAYLRSKGIDKSRLPIKVVGNAEISPFPSQSGKVDFVWREK